MAWILNDILFVIILFNYYLFYLLFYLFIIYFNQLWLIETIPYDYTLPTDNL